MSNIIRMKVYVMHWKTDSDVQLDVEELGQLKYISLLCRFIVLLAAQSYVMHEIKIVQKAIKLKYKYLKYF